MSESKTINMEIFSSLKCSFLEGRSKSYEWRIHQLKQIVFMIKENEQILADAIFNDLGRGAAESRLLELSSIEPEIKHVLSNLLGWMKPVCVGTPAIMAVGWSEYSYEPLGVALIISPFNYPVALSIWPLVGAIMAGNCAVLKTSELTPNVSRTLAALIAKYLDPECFRVMSGDASVTSDLLALPWDKIFFTGSSRVGRIVAAAAASHLSSITLELGGKCPVIIDEDCTNIAVAAKRVVWAKMNNAGQTCVAPDYVMCHAKHFDKFVNELIAAIGAFYGPDPSLSPDFGRIISEAHCDRIQALLDEEPGVVRLGGPVDKKQRFVPPTIITDVKQDSRIMRDEVFGPVLPVLRFDDLQEAIDQVTSLDKPLTVSLFTSSKPNIDRVKASVCCGGIVVNDCMIHLTNHLLPFGGVGNSGVGAYRGKFSFEAFSHIRAFVVRDISTALDVPAR